MMCYRDRTYCSAACATADCSRLITDDVEAAARRAGLPLALSDFRDTCGKWTPEDPKPGEEENMTHEEAVRALMALGFAWTKQAGHTIEEPSDSTLTREPGCCHGWIEIRGAPGLVGEVDLRVDEWDEFALRFPSLADLVARIAPPSPSPRGSP